MRYIALATLALLTVGTFDARTASAATWQCVGPASRLRLGRRNTEGQLQEARATARPREGQPVGTPGRQAHNKVAKKKASGSYSAASYRGGSGGGSGMASYYWQGQQTASGARFNPNGLTAAHRTLPFGTRVLVTNHSNGRTVTVTINDRGPFIKGRVIDLSRGAASVIGMTGQGVARVSYTVVGRG